MSLYLSATCPTASADRGYSIYGSLIGSHVTKSRDVPVHSTAAVAYPINLIIPDIAGARYLYLHVRNDLQFITLCFNIGGGVCVNDNACLKTAHFHVDKSTFKC